MSYANDVWFRSSRSMRVTTVWNRWLALAHVTHGLHVALVKFADKRRSWQHVQLDLLYTIDRPWLILHAELSSWCPERVSIFSLDYCHPSSRTFPLYIPWSTDPRDSFATAWRIHGKNLKRPRCNRSLNRVKVPRAFLVDSSRRVARRIRSIEVRMTERPVVESSQFERKRKRNKKKKNGRLPFFLFVREFSNERTRVERRAAYQKAKRKRLFTTAFSAYLKWITQAGFETIDLSLNLLFALAVEIAR